MAEMFIKTVKLTVPVTLKGVEFSELKVPIPRGKDLRLLPMDPKKPSDFFPLLCSCLGITEEDIDQLAANDILMMVGAVSNFLENTTALKPS